MAPVFYCAAEKTLPKATPWYLPATEPEFASVGTEIQQAVAVYRPSSEGVMVIVIRHDEERERLRLRGRRGGPLGAGSRRSSDVDDDPR